MKVDLFKNFYADIIHLSALHEELINEINSKHFSQDLNVDWNVIIEIESVIGGDESNIFVGDLFDMYSKYIEKNNWKIVIMNSSNYSVGGFSNIAFKVLGKVVFWRSSCSKGSWY